MKGYNRLFLVLTLLWAAFWTILYPLHMQWVGQDEAVVDYNRDNKNCDVLMAERPEWDMTKDCYQRSSRNFRHGGTLLVYAVLDVPSGLLAILFYR